MKFSGTLIAQWNVANHSFTSLPFKLFDLLEKKPTQLNLLFTLSVVFNPKWIDAHVAIILLNLQ